MINLTEQFIVDSIRARCFSTGPNELDENGHPEWEKLSEKIPLLKFKKNLTLFLKKLNFLPISQYAEGEINLESSFLYFGYDFDKIITRLLYQHKTPIYRFQINNRDHFLHPFVYYALKKEFDSKFNVELYDHLYSTLSPRTFIDNKSNRFIKLSLPIRISGRVRFLKEDELRYSLCVSQYLNLIQQRFSEMKFLLDYAGSPFENLPKIGHLLREFPDQKYLPICSFIDNDLSKIRNEYDAFIYVEWLKSDIIEPLFELHKKLVQMGFLLEFHGQNVLVSTENHGTKFYYRDMESVSIDVIKVNKLQEIKKANLPTFIGMYNLERFKERLELSINFFHAVFLEPIKKNHFTKSSDLEFWFQKNITLRKLHTK